MTTATKIKRTIYAGAIAAACDKSAEQWTADLRKREGAAFRVGYADAMVGKNRVSRQPYGLRKSYREGQARAREMGDAFGTCEAP